MTISKKLYVSFGAVLAMVVVLFVINLWSVHREHSAKAAASQALELADATDRIRFQMMQNRLYLTNFLLSGDSREADHVNDGIRTFGERMEVATSLSTSVEQRNALEKVQQTEQSWAREFAEPLMQKRKEVDQGNSTVAELQIFYLQKDAASWVKTSSEYLDLADRESKKVLEERRKIDESTSNWTIGISLLSTLATLVLGWGIAFRTSKSITEPLTDLMNVTAQIGTAGDLDHQIDIQRKDEIGELGRTFNGMVGYLKEMAAVSEAIAGGNLSVEVKPRSKDDTLGNAFVRMVDGLRNLVRNVRDAASRVPASASSQVAGASDDSAKVSLQTSSAIDEVTSTMHEMSVNVQNMVKSTQMQASSVSETSASIDEMVASIQRVADTAKVLLDISNRSREEVHSGIATMEKATDGLNKINTTIRSSGEIIDVLGQRADDIGKIIEVIDDLAEQTNLLALNAAIEAARAPASMVWVSLWSPTRFADWQEKSAQSTKEISELIQSIQKEARKAVENMDRSTGIVNDGLGLGQELNGALRKIYPNVVTEVYKFAQEIGAATNERSHGSSQIARATTRLNEITHEINSAVEEQAFRRAGCSPRPWSACANWCHKQLGFHRTGSLGRANVEDVARVARCHAPFRPGATAGTDSDTLRRAGSGQRPARRGRPRLTSGKYMNQELHIVGFQVGRETYGVPITSLHEIVRVPEITAVPDAPDYMEGVINLRGKIVSVIDLRKRFGEAKKALNRRNRILVVEHGGRLSGLIVDSASEVIKIPAADVEASPAAMQEGGLNCVTGLGKYHGRLIVLLDMTKLLDNGARKEEAERSSGEARSAAAADRGPRADEAKDKLELMGTSSVPAQLTEA